MPPIKSVYTSLGPGTQQVLNRLMEDWAQVGTSELEFGHAPNMPVVLLQLSMQIICGKFIV